MNEFSPFSTGFSDFRSQLDIQTAAPVKLEATRKRSPPTMTPTTMRANRLCFDFARSRRRRRSRAVSSGSGAGRRPRPRLLGLTAPPGGSHVFGRLFQTDARAKPARPDDGSASGASREDAFGAELVVRAQAELV